MNWNDDATKYVTATGHDGKILNTFLKEHEDDMAKAEVEICNALSKDPNFNGVRFSMAGYISSPSFTLDGYHQNAKIAVCSTSIDIENPDWKSAVSEFLDKWGELGKGGIEKVNSWYDEQSKWGWD